MKTKLTGLVLSSSYMDGARDSKAGMLFNSSYSCIHREQRAYEAGFASATFRIEKVKNGKHRA